MSKIAHEAGVPLVIDNTMASPYLCRPIEHGADIVVHSATKFLGGHGTSIGGIIIDSGKFPWTDKYPAITEPSPGYHGMKFAEVFGPLAYIIKVRVEGLRDFGPCISPFNSFLFIQGIETLKFRMEAHSRNALAVAQWLEQHPAISWVKYPGLKSSPYYDISQKYLPKGQGSIVTFGIKGGTAAGRKLIDNVKIFSHLANLGDAKSLIIHPSSTTHQQLSDEQQLDAGVSKDLVRLSVGIEDVDDLTWDLEQAIAISQTAGRGRSREGLGWRPAYPCHSDSLGSSKRRPPHEAPVRRRPDRCDCKHDHRQLFRRETFDYRAKSLRAPRVPHARRGRDRDRETSRIRTPPACRDSGCRPPAPRANSSPRPSPSLTGVSAALISFSLSNV